MGHTAGLAQTTGVKTADGLFAAARRAGELLSAPRKLHALVAQGTEKKRQVQLSREIEHVSSRIGELYTRIGERVCNSPEIDRFVRSAEPQLEALISMVRDLEAESRALEQRLQCSGPGPPAPEHDESASVMAHTEPGPENWPAGDVAGSPAVETRQEPPSGAP